jgi:hypothetical protein
MADDTTPAAPVPEPRLDQVLDYSRLVLALGVAGAPGAAHTIATLAPALVVEILAFRAERDRPPADIVFEAMLLRIRVKEAEKRATHLGAAGEELLREIADERGTREALDRRVAELRARVAELEQLLGPRPVAVNPAAEGRGPVLVVVEGGAA